MSDDVTLTHPDGHGPITVPARRGRILVRQGWTYADGASTTSTPPADDLDNEDDPDLSTED